MKTTCFVLKLGVLLLLFVASACKKEEIAKPVQNKAGVEALVNPNQILVHAGTIQGSLDGPALQAQFDCPTFISVGPDKSLYVYDNSFYIWAGQLNKNHRKIRKISCLGVVTTFYSVANQDADIEGMAVDKDGNVYISQYSQIKKISADGKTVKVVAGSLTEQSVRREGPALEVTFGRPAGLAINKAGCLFILDRGYNDLRMLSNNVVKFVAGGNVFFEQPKDGVGINAEFDRPQFLSIDSKDNLYVTGGYYAIIRKVTPKAEVSTIAIQQPGFSGDHLSTFSQTTVDQSGNLYASFNNYIGDERLFDFLIYKFSPDNQKILLAENHYDLKVGSGVFVPANGLLFPIGFAAVNDTLYFSNTVEQKIRKISLH
ncbi:hypothetical protein [Mucilaginibacter aquariorum]|uniref:NHL repeat-containing protein n=1 Tax=Mucilaginibacter aquariorum TaxID=2967225 RepID=A0ABT1TAC0_9SPHI|nr:hypothetical protein [Mucilaginibacter aquariorum]MCQ6961590.1 hypothetical protein [Mucilaginibacter aquariorum]